MGECELLYNGSGKFYDADCVGICKLCIFHHKNEDVEDFPEEFPDVFSNDFSDISFEEVDGDIEL